MEPASGILRKTPLNAVHRASGAKMVDFGGWDMPVQYSGILDEHATVRNHVGLFDVSHMGEIEVRGPQALDLVNWVSCNDAAKLQVGQAHYSGLILEGGGFVDDILVHKFADDHFFLCVNASNQEKDFAHIQEQNALRGFDADVTDSGPSLSQIAVQGPRAVETLQKLTATPLAPIHYYWFTAGEVSGTPATIARTGYTGEDGFEIYVSNSEAPRLWRELLAAGEEFGIKPAGLGARNTLRLEAAMALYGHEITDALNPLEAGLSWIVKMDKGDFLGKPKLAEIKAAGLKRKLRGFKMNGRGIGRDGYEIQVDGAPAGWVTSGGPGPTVNLNIGLCYLPIEKSSIGQPIQVMIRNQAVDAEVIATPFYKRAKIMYPDNYKYTKEHEWILIEGDTGTIGITDHAQQELGDIVYVDLPKPGTAVEVGKALGSVESVMAVSDIYSPVNGEILESNTELAAAPEKLNADPHGDAWLVKVKLANAGEIEGLMTAAEYQAYLGG